MLVLTRRPGETIVIGADVRLTVLSVGREGKVRLGVEAPRAVRVALAERVLTLESPCTDAKPTTSP